jgi:hypothetical protein
LKEAEACRGGWRSGELEAFEFDVGGMDVGQVVMGLLGAPGFGAAAEDFGKPDGHFGGYAALSIHQFRVSGASDSKGGGSLGDGQAERLDALAQDEAHGCGGFFIGMVCSPSMQYFPGNLSATVPQR